MNEILDQLQICWREDESEIKYREEYYVAEMVCR